MIAEIALAVFLVCLLIAIGVIMGLELKKSFDAEKRQASPSRTSASGALRVTAETLEDIVPYNH